MNRYVVDASVTAKWFLPEIHQQEAMEYLIQDTVLFAPEILKVEFDSVLSKWCRSGRLDFDRAVSIRSVFSQIQIYYTDLKIISDIGFEVSSKNSVTYYDALYLCTAKLNESEMVSFDRKLEESVKGTEFEKYVKVIG